MSVACLNPLFREIHGTKDAPRILEFLQEFQTLGVVPVKNGVYYKSIHRVRMTMTMTAIDLFSGLGGISHALQPFVRTIMYCEKDATARSVLVSNMEAGTIDSAPIHEDVCTLSSSPELPRVDIVLAGVPCVGFSSLGLKRGFDNSQSNLFFDMLKVVDECECGCVFLENVPGIMDFKDTLVSEMVTKRGFKMRWMIQAASELGAPHHRKRWYCFAHKPEFEDRLLHMDLVDDRVPFDWFAGVPPPRTVKADDKTHRQSIDAGWALLGNSVVPDAVRTAFFRLYTLGRCTHLRGDGRSYEFAVHDDDDGCNIGIAKDATTYDICMICDARECSVLRRPGRRQVVPRRIVLDPSLVPLPAKTSRNQTTPLVREPITFKFFSTPRHGMLRPCRVLTSRSSRDLPTQIMFEKNTRNRHWPASPKFGQWMMGYPPEHVVMPANDRQNMTNIVNANNKKT